MSKKFDYIKLVQKINITNVISIFNYKYTTNYCFDGERHNFWEFIFVEQGALEVTANNKAIILKENNVLFHQPDEFHALKTLNGKSASAIICSFTCEDKDMNFFKGYSSSLDPQKRDILHRLLKLRSNLFFNDSVPFHSTPKSNELIPDYCKQLCKNYIEIFLLSLIVTPKSSTKIGYDTKKHSLTQEIVVYLSNNIHRKITLEEISIAMGYSVSHIRRVFYHDMQQGIIEYFNRLKIDESKKMIDSNVPLSEIANNLSFNDLAYFSRKFKQYEGISPTEYKHNLATV